MHGSKYEILIGGIMLKKYWWRILTTPACWMRNYPTSKVVDKWINKQIDGGLFIIRNDNYIAIIDTEDVWIGNYPYAYGWLKRFGGLLPSRSTVFRLHDELTRLGVHRKEKTRKELEKEMAVRLGIDL
jgi:hypothetical protein